MVWFESSRLMTLTLKSDGIISSLSRNASQVSGYAVADLIGEPVTRIMADRTAFEIQGILRDARRNNVWEGSIYRQSRSGEITESTGLVSFMQEGGEGSGCFLMALSDVEPAGARAPGESTSQVGARLRSLSHELNNTLAIITGFAQLVMIDPKCDGPMKANMEKLHDEIQRMTEIMERLHSFGCSLQQKPPEKLSTNS